MQIPPPRPAVASPPFDKGGTNKERFKIIYVCKAGSCRHQGKTWRLGHRKRKSYAFAHLISPRTTGVRCAMKWLVRPAAASSPRILVGRLRNASRFARHVAVSPRHTNSGCPLFYEECRSSQFAAVSRLTKG